MKRRENLKATNFKKSQIKFALIASKQVMINRSADIYILIFIQMIENSAKETRI
jgi:hypothetical protein